MNELARGIFKRLFALIVGILCISFIASGSADSVLAQDEENDLLFPLIELNSSAEAPICRIGVNATADVSSYDLAALRVGWYMNFETTLNAPRPGGIDYLPVIRLCATGVDVGDLRGQCYPDKVTSATVTNWVKSVPGAEWFIGNEPDRPDHVLAGQDAVTPEDYAQYYHELYHLIKAADPSAKVLAGSIVQPTEVRLKYLDLVLDAYKERYGNYMPVDGWSIHNYILNEKSCDHFPRFECWGAEIPPGVSDVSGLIIDVQQNDDFSLFVSQIERFRLWMAQNGYRTTPLYLSEFGVLMPAGVFMPDFDAARVNRFMTKTFDYLRTETNDSTGYPADGNRLVQRFSWYSTTDNTFNGRLFEVDTKQLTNTGSHFASYVAPIPLEADFYPLNLSYSPSAAVSNSSALSVTLQATIANSGNTLAAYDVRVQFYQGDPNNGGMQIGADQVVSIAGCGDTQTVSVVFENAPLDLTPIYVVVAPVNAGTTPEPQPARANNVKMFLLLAGGEKSYLPQVSR